MGRDWCDDCDQPNECCLCVHCDVCEKLGRRPRWGLIFLPEGWQRIPVVDFVVCGWSCRESPRAAEAEANARAAAQWTPG